MASPLVNEIIDGYRFTGGDPNSESSWVKADTPQVGDIVDGYKFKGGDLNKHGNWESVDRNALVQSVAGLSEEAASGVGRIQAGIGQFIQAPAANMLSGLAGLKSAAVRGLVGDKVADTNKDFAGMREDVRGTAAFAKAEREKNVQEGGFLARLGKAMEETGKGVKGYWEEAKKEDAPMLVEQQKAIGEAKGFVGTTKAMLANPLGTAGAIAGSLPDLVVGMGAGAVAARLTARLGAETAAKYVGEKAVMEAGMKTATMAEREALAAGASASEASAIGIAAGDRAIMEAATTKAAGTAGLLSEAASSAMSSKQDVSEFVNKMSFEDLANSARFKELAATMSPEKARAQLAEELGSEASLAAGIWTGAMNKLTGSAEAVGKTVATGRASAKEVGKGALKEGVEEGLQSPGEEFSTYRAKVQADQRETFDLGGSIAKGLITGTAMGAGIHGTGYLGAKIEDRRKAPEEIADAVMRPDASLDEAIATAKAETGPTGEQSDAELLSLVNARTAPAQVSQPAQEVVNGTQAAQAIQAEPQAPEQDARIAGLLKTASDDSIARVAEIDKSLAQNPADETLKAERDKITASWPATVPGKKESVKADSGADINYQWALIPADKEVRSHDTDMRENRAYPQELQPRDRERVMSSVQAGEMQQKYNPARAGYSPDIQNGAPIISRDGVVLSGNLRSIVQARIIQEGGKKADELRQHWIDTAEQYGYTGDQLRQAFKENPKLVLRRMLTDPINREEFARQANAPTTAVMSRLEQGKSDAARIETLDDLEPDESGDFTGPASRGFIKSFVAKLPVTEQGEMISSDGQLSQSGVARIRNAILAKAYGDSPVLQRMTESLDDNMRNITKALVRVAPEVAKVREGIKSGDLHDSDITPHILEAVEEMSRLRSEGKTLANEFAQGSMFGDKFSPETKAILTYLDANIRRPRQIGDFIKAYAEKLAAAGSPKQESLLGEAKAPAKRGLIEAAQAEVDDGRRANRQEMAEAVGELGDWIRQNQPGVFNITPEDEVKILPILVKIASAGIKEVGYQMKDLLANIRRALAASKNEFIKKNRGEIMRHPVLDKAIKQAIDLAQAAAPKKKGGQKDLFAGQADTSAGQAETKPGSTADLFEQAAPAEPKKEEAPAKESKPDQEKKRERPSVSVPKGLKITLEREIGGKTESKLVDAKKALDISSRNVEKLEALRGCLG